MVTETIGLQGWRTPDNTGARFGISTVPAAVVAAAPATHTHAHTHTHTHTHTFLPRGPAGRS